MTPTPTQVKNGRLRAKLTQPEIADKFGLSERFWRKLENGETDADAWVHYALKGLHAEIADKKKRAKIRRETEKKNRG